LGSSTFENIRIEGGLGIDKLKELEFHIEANQHATARMVGRVSKKKYKEVQNTSYESHIVKIILLEEDGSEPEQPVFSGYPRSITFGEECGNCYLEIILSSGTILLDRALKSQSFQDVSMNYSSVIKKLVKSTPKASVICNENMTRKPAKPLIQYMETDWEFILRLASHLKGAVYPEVRQPYPRFWFGMPDSSKTRKIKSAVYEAGISEEYFLQGGYEAGLKQKDFLYYSFDSTKDYDIGDRAQFQSREWIICKKSAVLTRGELIFHYILGTEQLVALKRRYNPVFAGMTILGKVIKVEGETVRIHLDIDEEQSVDTAFAYDWVPDTGSTMYCMPKVGSTVSLYFSNEEESSAQAINCIKTGKVGVGKRKSNAAATSNTAATSYPSVSMNTYTGGATSMNGGGVATGTAASSGTTDTSGAGASEEEEENPDRKCLSTEHGKDLYLDKTSLGLSAEESGLELTIEDDKSLVLNSSKKLSIAAEGKVRLVGKKVVMDTPVELKLSKK
jgi:hypothetical protein